MVALDRKSLSEVAIHDPATFDKLVEIAKAAVAEAAKK
jgi:large subunit ribosomal protein L20